MPESYNKKRVKFSDKNTQIGFFKLVENRFLNNTKEIAKICKVGPRQISDWRNAKSTLSLYAFEKLLKITKLPHPTDIQIIDQYAHTKSAGKKGAEATIRKYGKLPIDEVNRKIKWKKWWETTGINKDQKILQREKIFTPKRSTDFAELCGILIGDGGITKWQMIITLNYETDAKYVIFVEKLLKKLFHISPKIYKINGSKAVNICVSRRNLIDFLNKQGIIIGNKLRQRLSIPEWIMKSPKYLSRCIRGMVDTDGSVVIETHKIKNKRYKYCRLNFTSASPILIKQTFQTFKKMGFNPKIRSKGRAVQLEKMSEICEYFKRVGTSNPKHLERLARSSLLKR